MMRVRFTREDHSLHSILVDEVKAGFLYRLSLKLAWQFVEPNGTTHELSSNLFKAKRAVRLIFRARENETERARRCRNTLRLPCDSA